MRRITIAAIPTLLLLGVAMPASGVARSHKAIPTCPPAGAHVLLADAQAAVYTVHERRIERTEGKREAMPIIATRGCDASSKRSVRLDWEYANPGSAESLKDTATFGHSASM